MREEVAVTGRQVLRNALRFDGRHYTPIIP